MTRLLEQAFQIASQLSEAEQDAIAAQLLSELQADERWQTKFAATQNGLAKLAIQALDEQRAGRTLPLNDDGDLSHD